MNFNLEEVQSENTGWKPLNAGVGIPAVLKTVEFGKSNEQQTEDLVFNFEGIADGNKGSFNFRVWANVFDTTDSQFDKVKADRVLAQVKHIIKAYLPESVAVKITGETWRKFAENVIKALNPAVTARPCKLKVILDNKNRGSFPLFPDFITTDLTPDRVLSLNSKINPKTNLPYERITPIDKPAAPANDFADMDFGPAPIPSEEDSPF
jgi:hypothetical protein